MGYDYRTGSSATSGSIDPLSGPKYDLADTVRAYTARVSPLAVILGIPWYGRAWSTASDAVRSKNLSGAQVRLQHAPSTTRPSSTSSTKYGRRWDSVEQSPYVVYRRENCTDTYGCVTSWRQVYYDDAASMKLRYALVNDYGLRGAGMWALGLRRRPQRALPRPRGVVPRRQVRPEAGIRMLAATQRDEGFVVSWAGEDASSHRVLRRPGLGGRRRLGGVADRHAGRQSDV